MDRIELEIKVLQDEPVVFIVGGVHGAGKSSFCANLLNLNPIPFVTPEEIKKSLTVDYTQQEIYRRIHKQVYDYLESGQSFIFEHVMSGHYVERLISKAVMFNFNVHLVYIDIESADLACSRVRQRVNQGGHHRERDVIEKRLGESRENFYNNYKNKASSWSLYCNSDIEHRCVATARHSSGVRVYIQSRYKKFIALCNGKS
ncbi:hypothetical protein MNBD_GAMMA12-3528 [hydrothermal vent metagenome]|uniref:UDP-N-acetylglucosamine kinase n=1 Tax=hydrothermal vent metagenome TaxID=652676 RepID=A0A3B0YG74_9ZZZZ